MTLHYPWDGLIGELSKLKEFQTLLDTREDIQKHIATLRSIENAKTIADVKTIVATIPSSVRDYLNSKLLDSFCATETVFYDAIMKTVKRILDKEDVPQSEKSDKINLGHYKANLYLIQFLLDNGADKNALLYTDNLDVLKMAIENGLDIRPHLNDLLLFHIHPGRTALLKFLLQNGASVKANNDEILVRVAQFSRNLYLFGIEAREFLNALLDAGLDIYIEGGEFVKMAIKTNNWRLLEAIIPRITSERYGFITELLLKECDKKMYHYIEHLLKHGMGVHINNDAISKSIFESDHMFDLVIANYLIEGGFDIEAEGVTYLRNSLKWKNPKVCDFLLQNGVNIFSLSKELVERNENAVVRGVDGRLYPESYAYWHPEDAKGILKVLIKHANTLTKVNHIWPIVSYFCIPELTEELLKRGADVHTDGEYALRRAYEFGSANTFKLLIQNGARTSFDVKRTDWGFRNEEINKFLTEKGIKLKSKPF